jgi:hypothetical protein
MLPTPLKSAEQLFELYEAFHTLIAILGLLRYIEHCREPYRD